MLYEAKNKNTAFLLACVVMLSLSSSFEEAAVSVGDKPWSETESGDAGDGDTPDTTDISDVATADGVATVSPSVAEVDERSIPTKGALFYHPYYTGNIAYVTDSSGTCVSRNYYKPYGEIYDTVGDNNYRAKYGEKEQSYKTGLQFFDARYYAPELGRFVQPDSLIADRSNEQGLNPYSYVQGSPVEFRDWSGHKNKSGFWKTVGMVAVGAVVAAATAAVVAAVPILTMGIAVSLFIGGAAAVGAAAGAMGGYNYAHQGKSFKHSGLDLVKESFYLGAAIGSNGVYALYVARIAVYGSVAAIGYGIYNAGKAMGYSMDDKWTTDRDDFLNWTFGKEYTIETSKGRLTLRARPWVPGDPHTTAMVNKDCA